jgi:hypothetical protein
MVTDGVEEMVVVGSVAVVEGAGAVVSDDVGEVAGEKAVVVGPASAHEATEMAAIRAQPAFLPALTIVPVASVPRLEARAGNTHRR